MRSQSQRFPRSSRSYETRGWMVERSGVQRREPSGSDVSLIKPRNRDPRVLLETLHIDIKRRSRFGPTIRGVLQRRKAKLSMLPKRKWLKAVLVS